MNRNIVSNNVPLQRLWTTEFVWIWLLSLSYFYCLPLLRTGVVLGVTASEIRLYDVVFFTFFTFFILPRFSAFMSYWNGLSPAHRYLFYWIVVAFFGLLLIMIVKGDRFFIAFIRYVRFFSFCSAFILMYVVIKNRRQLVFLFNSILIAIIFISVLGTLQGLGFLPNFWPDYYSAYWELTGGYLSTATLAPNHTHYSLVMAIGIIMVFTVLKVNPVISLRNSIFIAGLVPMAYSMILSQGRSGWLLIGVFLLYTVIFSKGRFITFALLAGTIFVVINYLGTAAQKTSVRDILLYRAINSHRELGRTSLDFFEEEEKNYIERVDDNRWFIYKKSIEHLSESPQYWIFGAGFQNASRALGGIALAAHNGYINIFAEHGIIGFVIYIGFLYHLLKMGIRFKHNANNRESFHFSNEWIGFFLGTLAVNFFAEVIYPGRALFTFLGTFFIITGLFLHPAWRKEVPTGE